MKCKITVIEDDMDLRSLLHNGLRLEGYSVCTYANGDEFLLSWQEDGPSDLYVIDINLGGITGFEICSRIKSKQKSRTATVILISANPEVQQRARDVSADDYMLKPFSQRELFAKINELLKQRSDNSQIGSQS
jgi:two-component system, OmpR family, phosphate regulon response regulator PhoB